jgi:hypothetical protein
VTDPAKLALQALGFNTQQVPVEGQTQQVFFKSGRMSNSVIPQQIGSSGKQTFMNIRSQPVITLVEQQQFQEPILEQQQMPIQQQQVQVPLLPSGRPSHQSDIMISQQNLNGSGAFTNRSLNFLDVNKSDIKHRGNTDEAAIEIFETLKNQTDRTTLSFQFPAQFSNLGYYLISCGLVQLQNLRTLKLDLQFGETLLEQASTVLHHDNRDKAMTYLGNAISSLSMLEVLDIKISNVDSKISEEVFSAFVAQFAQLKHLKKLAFAFNLTPGFSNSMISNRVGTTLGQVLPCLPELQELDLDIRIGNASSQLCFHFLCELFMVPVNLLSLRINFEDTKEQGTSDEEIRLFGECLKNNVRGIQNFVFSSKSPYATASTESLMHFMDSLAIIQIKRIELSMNRSIGSMFDNQLKIYSRDKFPNSSLILI